MRADHNGRLTELVELRAELIATLSQRSDLSNA